MITIANTGVYYMTAVNQATRVLNFLEKGNSLTSKQAMSRFKIKNLRARIAELREEGYTIGTKSVTFKDTGAQGVAYSLVKPTKRAR